MKYITFLLAVAFSGCNTNPLENNPATRPDSLPVAGSINKKDPDSSTQHAVTYSNQRFREVTVEKTGPHSFLVKGKAQIFEANVSWVIEDGHDELKKGFQTADAGAPEWGNFSFTVDVLKKRPNSTLHLVLFESSAKDGSRQHELPVFLY